MHHITCMAPVMSEQSHLIINFFICWYGDCNVLLERSEKRHLLSNAVTGKTKKLGHLKKSTVSEINDHNFRS